MPRITGWDKVAATRLPGSGRSATVASCASDRSCWIWVLARTLLLFPVMSPHDVFGPIKTRAQLVREFLATTPIAARARALPPELQPLPLTTRVPPPPARRRAA